MRFRFSFCALVVGLVAATGGVPSDAPGRATTVSIIHTFAGPEGANPWGGMVQATDGNLYGTTTGGGPLANGAMFRMTPAGTVTLLNYPSSAFQTALYGELIQGRDGFLYGTAFGPQTLQNTGGSAFRMSLAGAVTGLHDFVGNGDGSHPSAGLVEGSDGNFYGTTFGGAGVKSHLGSVFRITPAGVTTILHAFTQGEGAQPRGALVEGPDGSFYGTTTYYGANAAGSVFKITPGGTFTVLHQFAGAAGGAHPYAGLCLGADGNFYGTTHDGGVYNLGTVFRVTPAGQLTVLHAFAGNGDGSHPYAALIQAADGLFYGTTGGKGTSSWVEYGTVFQMTPDGQLGNLYAFNSLDGTTPIARLVQGSDGYLYGTTSAGGTLPGNKAGYGTVFRVELPPQAPIITTNPSDQIVSTGQDASFSAAATGVPSPTIQWQRSVDGGASWTNLSNAPPYSGATSSTLVLTGVPIGLNGARFRAVATNAAGSTPSAAATLTVNAVPDPRMSIDQPAANVLVQPPFTILGWAVDLGATSGSGVDQVQIAVRKASGGATTTLGLAALQKPRTDVAQIFGSQFLNSGYAFDVAALAAGSYDLTVSARSVITGTFSQSKTVTVTIPASDIRSYIDNPVANATTGSSFDVNGWAIDTGHLTNTGVDHVTIWSYPIQSDGGLGAGTQRGQATYGLSRTDVGAVFGSRFVSSGFSLSLTGFTPGRYRLIASIHSTVDTAITIQRSVDITVAAPVSNPMMAIDGPAANSTVQQPFLTGGWAVDRGAAAGSGVDAVHVWAYPVVNGVIDAAHGIFVAEGQGGGQRSDVGAVFGAQFAASGFTFAVQGLPAGVYELGVYARSTVTGTFNQVKFVRITINGSTPLMSLDGPLPNATIAQPFLTGGWAIDLASSGGSGVDAVHVWAFPIVNGAVDPAQARFVAQGTSGGARPDVGAVFGSQFTNSGYTFVMTSLLPGPYVLGVYARSTVTGTFNQAKFVTVTIQ